MRSSRHNVPAVDEDVDVRPILRRGEVRWVYAGTGRVSDGPGAVKKYLQVPKYVFVCQSFVEFDLSNLQT